MSIATLASDRIAGPTPSGVERIIARDFGEYGLADIDQRGVLTRWEQRGRIVLDGDADMLLQLSGVEVPDGQMRRHDRHSHLNTGFVRMATGGVSYGYGAVVDLSPDTLRVNRTVRNRNQKPIERRHALVLGVALAGAGIDPKIQDGEGQNFAASSFPLNETIVQPHGSAVAVNLGDNRLSLASNAQVVVGDEYWPAAEQELSLLVRRTEEVLYVGAAACGEGNGIILPPHHELQIKGSIALG